MGRHWDGVVIYTSDHQIDLHFRTTVGIILSVITSLGLLVLFKTNILNIEILFYSPLILGFAVSCCLYLKSEMADGGMIDKLCHISKVWLQVGLSGVFILYSSGDLCICKLSVWHQRRLVSALFHLNSCFITDYCLLSLWATESQEYLPPLCDRRTLHSNGGRNVHLPG